MKKLMVLVMVIIIVCACSADSLLSKQVPDRVDRNVVPTVATVLPAPGEKGMTAENKVIGYSSRGHIIQAVTITPPQYKKTILLTFAMHGFEDGWDYDGGSLVQIANEVIAGFTAHPEYLNQTRLIVVPCVNPDGLMRGKDDILAGRRNGQGIDINRDFDFKWKYCAETKYHTGDTPFVTSEANLLRDLVLAEQPDLVIDFHGWLNAIYGDQEIGQYFSDALAVANQGMNNVANAFLPQTFVGWAGQRTRAVMVEYPHPLNAANVNNLQYSRKTIGVIKQICQEM